MPEDHRIQYIAVFLIILACACLAVGELKNWAQLVGFALTFGGGGLGILTGQKLQQTTTKGGGDIVNPPAKDSQE